MNTSDNDSPKPLTNTATPAVSQVAPTATASEKPLDPRTAAWIQHLIKGMNEMATNEELRKEIAKKLF